MKNVSEKMVYAITGIDVSVKKTNYFLFTMCLKTFFMNSCVISEQIEKMPRSY